MSKKIGELSSREYAALGTPQEAGNFLAPGLNGKGIQFYARNRNGTVEIYAKFPEVQEYRFQEYLR
ncbi:MAG: hypothetical protein HZB67_02095 [Candidatus Aenigmarchaeota archaeon]|nr:hypothetical protein [Candidatus Aenigmarchaeota archaeon]